MIDLIDGVLYGKDREVAEWVADRIPGFTIPAEPRALAVIRKKRVAAAVCYENFNGVHIQASIAAEAGSNWASRRVLKHLFGYPFLQLNCFAISVTVAETNLVSLNLATKLGFRPEAFIRYAAHDRSTLIVLKMFKNDCKWIGAHGQNGELATSGA